MVQITSKLDRVQGGYQWFCPACQVRHTITMGQAGAGTELSAPSFPHRITVQGGACTYTLTNGFAFYDKSCTHELAGKQALVPDLPSSEDK